MGVVRQIAPRYNDRAPQLISENSSSAVNQLRVDYSAVSSADLRVRKIDQLEQPSLILVWLDLAIHMPAHTLPITLRQCDRLSHVG